jgi:hypothetical protein
MKKLVSTFLILALALLVGAVYVHANDDAVDEHGTALTTSIGDISADERAQLGDNANIGERLREQREEIRKTIEVKRAELRDRLDEGRAMIKQEIDARKGIIGEKRDEIHATVEARLGELLSIRFDAATGRLEKLTSRIESRMQILQSQGKDVSKAATEVALARASIATAKTNADALITLGFNGDIKTYRMKGQIIITSLKEAKVHLETAVQLLKGLSASGSATVTTH